MITNDEERAFDPNELDVRICDIGDAGSVSRAKCKYAKGFDKTRARAREVVLQIATPPYLLPCSAASSSGRQKNLTRAVRHQPKLQLPTQKRHRLLG